ncbi:DUF1028 domain-containing protein [Bradyrhizobium valentinum]|uniref:Fimbrial assembly protein FimA n=1 Tax=Bradyrhizobium valentinum TaxID=1518501 RepID=A0A0R3KWY0_9BRAD|nr:DUF1028 domain-containing protein [Bradyrhizobium valentinum]KRQ99993.1 hypothetical protein CQ10_24020 [Bradyrhizobium valentinum]KRR02173.1 hypothetical protein CP49_05250 [Bradyrhizobium valentinum]
MTYSIVARDAITGELGVASQSHYFALGRVVTFARAGVGAVATQSFVDPAYGPNGLDLMASGASAESALTSLLAKDAERELRQVAFLDAAGGTAMFTGDRCVPYRAQLETNNVVVLGNMLASDDVVPAMLAAYENTAGSLVERMLAAMDAGEAAGGDARGRMSAALLVVSADTGPAPWSNRVIDVRVDEHPAPLVELRRLAKLCQAHAIFGASVFTPGLLSREAAATGPQLAEALRTLTDAQALIGADLEPTFWKGVLLIRAGEICSGKKLVAATVAARPQYRAFVEGLHAVGILQLSSNELLGA